MTVCQPYRLHNQIQPYSWGERGDGAFIPRLLKAPAEAERPYAELWMGVHPNAPSAAECADARVPLPALLTAHPQEMLGARVIERFGANLPFLFKVLSAAEPLSIQTHPTLEQARRLHARDPQHYPDANHKPEIAIALDGLTALVGFRDLAAVRAALTRYPEIAEFVGAAPETLPTEPRAALRQVYGALLERSLTAPEALTAAIARLAERLHATTEPLEALYLDLCARYPGPDVGLFSLFLLQPVTLRPGQAIFIPAGAPHAYLRGNIIECMANSDNVVRVGLTPKFKDAATLLEILEYNVAPLPIVEGRGAAQPGEWRYHTPAAEFEVRRFDLGAGAPCVISGAGGPAIVLLTRGEAVAHWPGGALALQQGDALFLPACLEQLTLDSADGEAFGALMP